MFRITASKSGLIDVLFDMQPKYLLIDEIRFIMGKAVWDQRGDIRNVISIGKVVRKSDCPEKVELGCLLHSKTGVSTMLGS